MGKETTRRGFMEAVATTALAITLGRRAGLAAQAGLSEYNWEDYSYVYLVDVSTCIGCGMCVQACQKENRVPDGFFRTWVERYRIGEGGRVEVDSPNGGMNGFPANILDFKVTKGLFVPKLCNHCKNTPCTQVCPVGASYTTRDGVVLVDDKRCIGCGYCVQACPYGSRYLHPVSHVADKCTWCYHRITRGLKPACVMACPVGARAFGNMKNLQDPVRKTIATQPVLVLQPELLTRPNCYYKGLDKEVR